MNLQDEIDKFISDHAYEIYKTKDLPYKEQSKEQLRLHKIYTEELLQLFDKSVERVIKSADDVGKEIDKGIFHDRKKIDRKQRQTWNKIKSGKEKA